MSNYRTKPGYRDQYNPLRGLSLSRIVAMEDAAARGEMADLQWLWRHMQDTDVTVASAVAKRLSYIESLDWEIRTIENTDQILAAEQADVLRYAYERVQNLQEAATNIAYANFTGFSILEKIRTGYGPFVSRLEYIPCQYWNYRKDAKQWYFNPEARSGMSGSEIADPRELVIHEVPAPLFKPICRHFPPVRGLTVLPARLPPIGPTFSPPRGRDLPAAFLSAALPRRYAGPSPLAGLGGWPPPLRPRPRR